jgi:integrase
VLPQLHSWTSTTGGFLGAPLSALKRRGLSGGTIRHHLNTLGALYRFAGEQQRVAAGYNPISLWRKKPTAQRREARWLEVSDAALLLESARTLPLPATGRRPVPFAYPLIATFLLSGGRESEVLGLEVGDLSFDRRTVVFRPNEWRRLKTATSHRVVPMPAQLEEILRPHVFGDRPPARLLFPSFRTGQEAMLTDFRKLLDAVAMRAGWKPGEIRSKVFRHTFTAAALQLLDGGEPISVFTVAKWLGHGGTALVNRTYGHLGTVRHRSKALEYRVEAFAGILGDRLTTLQGDQN